MRVLLAPDAFKGSLSSVEACEAIARGLRAHWPEADLVSLPLADGGEGFVGTMVEATGGQLRTSLVRDPLGRPVEAVWGLLGDGETAVVEVAAASGLGRLGPDERDPLTTSSYGTGELIGRALDIGARRILLGLGGSATVDAGVGMASALGVRCLDRSGAPIEGGGRLEQLAAIDLSNRDPRLEGTTFEIAWDVASPLTGPDGAAVVFAPQKGAGRDGVVRLERGLERFAAVVRRELGVDAEELPGAGAAGGLGAGAVVLLGGQLRSGIELVLDAVGFDEALRGADLVITGEGRLDGQTGRGKVAAGVARRTRRAGVPVVALAGSLGEGVEELADIGLDAWSAAVDRVLDESEALGSAAARLEASASRMVRWLEVGARFGRDVGRRS